MESIIQILQDELMDPIDENIANIFREGIELQSWSSTDEVDLIFHDNKSINFSIGEVISSPVNINGKLMTSSIPSDSADLNKDIGINGKQSSKTTSEQNQILHHKRQKQFDLDSIDLDFVKNLSEKIDRSTELRNKHALLQAQKVTELTEALNTRTEVLRETCNNLKIFLDRLSK